MRERDLNVKCRLSSGVEEAARSMAAGWEQSCTSTCLYECIRRFRLETSLLITFTCLQGFLDTFLYNKSSSGPYTCFVCCADGICKVPRQE